MRLPCLGMTLCKARLGECFHCPSLCMDINSYENLLSFKTFFVTLHLGTVLIVFVLCFVCTCKNTIQLLSYQLFMQKTMKNTAVVCPAAGGAKPPKSVFQLLSLR